MRRTRGANSTWTSGKGVVHGGWGRGRAEGFQGWAWGADPRLQETSLLANPFVFLVPPTLQGRLAVPPGLALLCMPCPPGWEVRALGGSKAFSLPHAKVASLSLGGHGGPLDTSELSSQLPGAGGACHSLGRCPSIDRVLCSGGKLHRWGISPTPANFLEVLQGWKGHVCVSVERSLTRVDWNMRPVHAAPYADPHVCLCDCVLLSVLCTLEFRKRANVF